MTALTTNLASTLQTKFGAIQTYLVGAGTHIYRGALVVVRQTDGYAYAAIEDALDTYKQIVVGYAQEEIDATNSAAGAKQVRVRRDSKLRCYWTTTTSQALVGTLACVKDDQTAQPYGVSTGKVVIGRITEVSNTMQVFVDMTDRPQRVATSLND